MNMDEFSLQIIKHLRDGRKSFGEIGKPVHYHKHSQGAGQKAYEKGCLGNNRKGGRS